MFVCTRLDYCFDHTKASLSNSACRSYKKILKNSGYSLPHGKQFQTNKNSNSGTFASVDCGYVNLTTRKEKTVLPAVIMLYIAFLMDLGKFKESDSF